MKGAYRSYSNLIDEIIKSKKKDPRLDIALSLDVESLGGQLVEFSIEQRRRIAKENIERLTRRAHAVATHSEDIWAHARAESQRLGAPFTINSIRGVKGEID